MSNILFFPPNLKASGHKSVIEKLNVRKTETTINCCSNTLKENNMKEEHDEAQLAVDTQVGYVWSIAWVTSVVYL